MGPGYLQSIFPSSERLGCKRRVHPTSSLAIALLRPWLWIYLPLLAQPLPVEKLELVSDRILSHLPFSLGRDAAGNSMLSSDWEKEGWQTGTVRLVPRGVLRRGVAS